MISYILTSDLTNCYGCHSCEQVCKKHAIKMEPNSEGFLYPKVNKEMCVNCGACNKKCPFESDAPLHSPLYSIAAQNINQEELLSSSSGGMFSVLADFVISKEGYIAGCIFDDSFHAIHVLSNDKTVVEKMRGSKYVQSDLRDIYSQVKECLLKGALVLFSGTPCQVDGLTCFLGEEYDNLITVDLICHGVPSPKLLSDYIHSIESDKGTVSDIKFRDKQRNGWCSQGSVTIKKKTKTITPYNDSYYNLYYLQNSVSRMSCYACKYSTTKRVGDITIGDYWNVSDDFPDVDSRAGFSAVLVNTEKGKHVLEKISDNIISYDTSVEAIAKSNGNLCGPCSMPSERKDIYDRIEQNGYTVVAKQECRYQYVLPFVKKHFPKSLKKMIKGILAEVRR